MARSTVRTIYTLGFLTLGLLTSTSIVSPARADSAVAQTDWTINRVASVASGSYCTMAQKYSDNTILTFAKNQSGEYSLAFDFIKPEFPDATTTTVSLRAGTGAAQTFSVAPTSDKVIVIGLGANDSFVKAVKSSAKIDLESGGKVHSFTTTKFSAAADELSECTGGMKPSLAMAKAPVAPATIVASVSPASGEPAPSSIVANPSVKDVAPMSSDTAELANIQAENAQLKRALTEARQSYQAQQNNSQTAATSELQEKLSGLQKENEALKSQKVMTPEMTAELARTKADLAAIQAQNQTLQAQALLATQSQQASASTSQQLAQLQKQNADMKAELNTANQTVGQLQAKATQSASTVEQLAMLQKQNADMKLQLGSATATVSQLQMKSAEATNAAAQLSNLQKQNADMKVQLDAANQTVGQLQAKTIQSASAAQQVEALTKQSAEMKMQLEAANKTVADLQAKNIQTASAAGQLTILQKENADIKLQLATATQTINQLQLKTAQSSASAEQIAALQKQLETSNQTVSQLQAKAAQSSASAEQMAALQKQLETSNQTVTQLQAKIAQTPAVDPNALAQAQAAEKENASLKQQIAALQSAPLAIPAADKQQMMALQSENAALKSQLSDIQSKGAVANASPEIKELQTKFDSVVQENVALKTQLANKPVSTASVSEDTKALQSKLDSVTQENAVLKTQITAMQSPAGGAQASATGSNWDLEQATKRYQESQREIQRLASKIQDQQKQFEQDKKDLQDKLFDPAVADQAQRDQLNALQQKVSDLEAGKPVTQVEASAAPVSPMAVPVPQVVKAPEQVANITPAAGTPTNGRQEVDELPIPGISMPMGISSKSEDKPIKSPVASAIISPVAKVSFQSKEAYQGMLKNAGINIHGPVEEVAGGNSDTYRAYRWKTDSLFGSVEQRAMKDSKAFDPAVNEYLSRAKSRCSGDFAAVPSDVSVTADKVKSFEIACLGGKENTSASVLFTYGNDVMTTLAHEGKSEAMDLAMEARDRIASQMGGVKTASK